MNKTNKQQFSHLYENSSRLPTGIFLCVSPFVRESTVRSYGELAGLGLTEARSLATPSRSVFPNTDALWW